VGHPEGMHAYQALEDHLSQEQQWGEIELRQVPPPPRGALSRQSFSALATPASMKRHPLLPPGLSRSGLSPQAFQPLQVLDLLDVNALHRVACRSKSTTHTDHNALQFKQADHRLTVNSLAQAM